MWREDVLTYFAECNGIIGKYDKNFCFAFTPHTARKQDSFLNLSTLLFLDLNKEEKMIHIILFLSYLFHKLQH